MHPDDICQVKSWLHQLETGPVAKRPRSVEKLPGERGSSIVVVVVVVVAVIKNDD